MDEQVLRERKESLQTLFEAVSIRPSRKSEASRTDVGKKDKEYGDTDRRPKSKSKENAKEVIGDDEDAEEIEVEGEELDDQQISIIYKK